MSKGKRRLTDMVHYTAIAAEKGLSEIALPAAVLSTTASGNYLERAVGGVTTTLSAVKGCIEAYLKNDGVRDVVNGAGVKVMQALGDMGANLADDPDKVLYAGLGTYAACKILPYVSRKLRQRISSDYHILGKKKPSSS